MSSTKINDLLWSMRATATRPRSLTRTAALWEGLASITGTHSWDVPFDYACAHEMFSPTELLCMQHQHEAALERRPWRNPIDQSEMIWIPGGPCLLKDPIETKVVGGFSMARHPVTNAQFQRFLAQSGYQPISRSGHREESFLRHWQDADGVQCREAPPKLAQHPVTWVSWLDAAAYCRWAGLVLPTPLMWEKAARGTDGRLYPWGHQPPVLLAPHLQEPHASASSLAQLGAEGTCPIGQYPRTRTAYGCQDMAGNVNELCLKEEPTHPQGLGISWPSHREQKGRQRVPICGSSYSSANPNRLHCATIQGTNHTQREAWMGFRPAFVPMFAGESAET